MSGTTCLACHGAVLYCAAGPVTVRPVPDQYALATDEQRDQQKDVAIALKPHFVAGLVTIAT